MDARFEEDAKDFAQVGLDKRGSTGNLVQGPVLDGSTEYHTDSSDEETTECSQVGHISANQSPTDEMSASESACLLTLQGLNPTSSAETEPSDTKAPAVASSACSFKNGHVFPKEESSRAPPICTPPTAAANRPRPLCTHSPGCGGFCEAEKKHASSGSSPKSQRSLKTSTSQIQGAAGDDRCARCILACLFCELLSACSLLIRCLDCGPACEGVPCCCGAGDAECAACGGDACGGGLDYGACCESSSFLELCIECGSICFAA
ncbi:uncharacterized protein LOC108918158 isoform X2 [Scleropages formosus]|uniref:uncharacterized protein LOC108918158 isoform X2 n=1 Tax=Scleropages formosus TaxID=113540 RepID=UPI0010FA7D10|nr:uncharacterized protein LOC108918158 isoform X2 [Scleropages formosus]